MDLMQPTSLTGLVDAVMSALERKAPWFEITDDLPQYEDYPPPA